MLKKDTLKSYHFQCTDTLFDMSRENGYRGFGTNIFIFPSSFSESGVSSRGSGSGTALQDLLHILAVETGQDPSKFQSKTLSRNRAAKPKPLTVEDLLNKPFYTVETNEEPSENQDEKEV